MLFHCVFVLFLILVLIVLFLLNSFRDLIVLVLQGLYFYLLLPHLKSLIRVRALEIFLLNVVAFLFDNLSTLFLELLLLLKFFRLLFLAHILYVYGLDNVLFPLMVLNFFRFLFQFLLCFLLHQNASKHLQYYLYHIYQP